MAKKSLGKNARGKLTKTDIKNAKPKEKDYKLFDGGGLHLYVTTKGVKSWRISYRWEGKERTPFDAGVYPEVDEEQARGKLRWLKNCLANGLDPKRVAALEKAQEREKEQRLSDTFKNIAEQWYPKYEKKKLHKKRSKDRITGYLNDVLYPKIGELHIREITPQEVLKIVDPIQERSVETAHRVKDVISKILDFAVILEKIQYNPILKLSEVMEKVEHESYPGITQPKRFGQLLKDISHHDGYESVYYYLQILPHVFTRPVELRCARWKEIDWEEKLLIIPKERVKNKRELLVPISNQVLELMRELYLFSGDTDLLFPGVRSKKTPIRDAAPLAALRAFGYKQDEHCLHGFRTSASTLLNELGFREDVIEIQMDHWGSDKVRKIYNRAEYLNERRVMMQLWSDYIYFLKADRIPFALNVPLYNLRVIPPAHDPEEYFRVA